MYSLSKARGLNYVSNWTQLVAGSRQGPAITTPLPYVRVPGSGNALRPASFLRRVAIGHSPLPLVETPYFTSPSGADAMVIQPAVTTNSADTESSAHSSPKQHESKQRLSPNGSRNSAIGARYIKTITSFPIIDFSQLAGATITHTITSRAYFGRFNLFTVSRRTSAEI
jgi:hypothetical protein